MYVMNKCIENIPVYAWLRRGAAKNLYINCRDVDDILFKKRVNDFFTKIN